MRFKRLFVTDLITVMQGDYAAGYTTPGVSISWRPISNINIYIYCLSNNIY